MNSRAQPDRQMIGAVQGVEHQGCAAMDQFASDDPRRDSAASEAVRRWQFQPVLINRVPVHIQRVR